ncbi:uncharacterized protein LOC117111950 isoform X2 [Anneissia japonica]|nr:uncharacterized protein LOC117111950 isoform X2 [Anneissia japonica]XP_033110901.1 uncharacterized protein LOC117111950 isoform X2 [Anneissia japonica]
MAYVEENKWSYPLNQDLGSYLDTCKVGDDSKDDDNSDYSYKSQSESCSSNLASDFLSSSPHSSSTGTTTKDSHSNESNDDQPKKHVKRKSRSHHRLSTASILLCSNSDSSSSTEVAPHHTNLSACNIEYSQSTIDTFDDGLKTNESSDSSAYFGSSLGKRQSAHSSLSSKHNKNQLGKIYNRLALDDCIPAEKTKAKKRRFSTVIFSSTSGIISDQDRERKRKRFGRTFHALRKCGLLNLTLQTAALMEHNSILNKQLKDLKEESNNMYKSLMKFSTMQPNSGQTEEVLKLMDSLKSIVQNKDN